ANPNAEFLVNGVVKHVQTRRMHIPAAISDRKFPLSILISLVFCQALSSSAHRLPPPGFSYLPSLSCNLRQHPEALQLWTVSYDRPSLRIADVASYELTAELEHYDESR